MARSDSQVVSFDQLHNADLHLDAIYSGGSSGTVADDPIGKLLPVGNAGGFRTKGPRASPFLVALCSSGRDHDWPDVLDRETGLFTYFGDNRTPGRAVSDTQRGGNQILENTFARLHRDPHERHGVSPFLLFQSTGRGRDNRFLGVAVPGAEGLQAVDDLVALWRTSKGRRFQNYRARFSVLDIPVVSRRWICDVIEGDVLSDACPEPFRDWVLTGRYQTLRAPRTLEYRSKSEQLPENLAVLQEIHRRFRGNWHDFEPCAAVLWRMLHGPAVRNIDVTRPSADGGRDAVGTISVGPESDPVLLDFCLEAKCYDPERNSVGVKDTSRLISRLRHRQFGVLVTTSWVGAQAYEEIRTDGHPVVVMSGADIVETLRTHGISSVEQVRAWLDQDFRQALS